MRIKNTLADTSRERRAPDSITYCLWNRKEFDMAQIEGNKLVTRQGMPMVSYAE